MGLDLCEGALWELCDANAGTADEFHVLQEALSRIDFQSSLLCAERSELAYYAVNMAYIERRRDAPISDLFFKPHQDEKSASSIAVRAFPNGFLDGNSATFARWRYDYAIEPLRDGGFRQLLVKQREFDAFLAQQKSEPIYKQIYECLPLISESGSKDVICRAIYAQCLVNEAIAACALERYHIEHGGYPDSLADANRAGETSIPLDVISGKPMGYRKTANGKYALWCVGFDGKDDGGKRVYDEKNPSGARFSDPGYLGDWVWDFAAK